MKRTYLIPTRDAQPLYIQQSSPLPGATQGVFYSFQFSANGGTAPYTWSQPPADGLTTDHLTGLMSGVPIAAGTFNPAVTVTDAVGTQVTVVFSVTVAPSVTSGFFGDPFATYTNFIADLTFAGTPGTVTSVPWNNSTISGETFSTPQAAINAAAGQPLTRVCFLAGQVWNNMPLNMTIPSTAGCTSANRFVLQGDPAATSGTMPVLDWANVGNGQMFQLAGNGSVDNRHVTFRKLEMRNCGSASQRGNGIVLNGGVTVTDDLIVEFCHIHDILGFDGSNGSSGPIYGTGYGGQQHVTVRNNKFHDVFITTDSTYPFVDGRSGNWAAVGLIGGYADIYNNLIYNVYAAVHYKGGNTQGNTFYNNIVHHVNNVIDWISGGAGGPYQNFDIHGNLAYTCNVFTNTSTSPSNTQSNNFAIHANTVAEDIKGGIGNPDSFTGLNVYDNFVLCTIAGTVNLGLKDPISGATSAIQSADHNAYALNSGTPFFIRRFTGEIDYANLAAWQAAGGTVPELPAGLEANSKAIPLLTAPFNTVAGNMNDPNYATSRDYTIKAGSPLLTMSSTGGAVGYDPTNIGPGW